MSKHARESAPDAAGSQEDKELTQSRRSVHRSTTDVMTRPEEKSSVKIDSAGERRVKARSRREARVGWAFMLPFAIAFIFVFVFPIISSIKEAFFRDGTGGAECENALYGCATGAADDVVHKTFVGLENFKFVFASEQFWRGMGRVFLFGIVQVPIMILAALFLAIWIDSKVIKRVTAFRLGYFLPYAVPGVVAALIWTYLYHPQLSPIVQGLQNLGVNVDFFSQNILLWSMANITTWTFTGYNMLIFLAALQAIPNELYEAARIDGATGWQIITKIKIPMVRGAALLAVLLSIIGTVQLFNEPTVLAVNNPWMGKDYTPMMMAYNTAVGGSLSPSGVGPASAISLVMALIAGVLAALYALLQRKVDK